MSSGWRRFLISGLAAATLTGVGAATASADEGGTLISFDSMTPVSGANVAPASIRGIVGGGVPWLITSGSGSVDKHTGAVHVAVTGLVIQATGVNPVATFSAIVSCVTKSGVVNVTTAAFAANTAGNSTIDATVSLPKHCKDPIVFVANGAGTRWFAMSNANDDEDEDEGDDD
jgi:hypothetical protein